MTREDFDDKLTQAFDKVLEAMAESSEVNPDKFFTMACILENLAFFSPVLYGALRKQKEQ